jgi:hypothetical protein
MTLFINALLYPSQYLSLQVYTFIDSAHSINNSLYSFTNKAYINCSKDNFYYFKAYWIIARNDLSK